MPRSLLPLPARVYVPLSGFYLIYYATLGAWLPFWGLYMHNKGYSVGQIAFVMGVIVAMRIPGPLLFGYLSDRFNNHMQLVRLCSLLAALSFALLLLLPDNYLNLVLVVMVSGFFWASALPQAETHTLSLLGKQPELYSLVRLWGSAGFAIAVLLIGIILTLLDTEQLPLIVLSLLSCIWLVSLALPAAGESTGGEVQEASSVPLLKNAALPVFLISCTFLHISHGPFYVFFTLHLKAMAIGSTVTGLLWALSAVAELLLLLMLPLLLRNFDLNRMLYISLILTVVRWVMTALAGDNLLILSLAQCLHAASYGCFHAAGIEWVRRNTASVHRGKAQSLYNSSSLGAGAILGTWGSGLIWPYGAVPSFMAAAGAALIGLLLMWLACRLQTQGLQARG